MKYLRTLPFIGLVLLGLSASGFLSWLPAGARFLWGFCALVWVPGAVIVRTALAGAHRSHLVRVPLHLAAGSLVAASVAYASSLAGASFDRFAVLVRVTTALLLIVCWVIEIRRIRMPRAPGLPRDMWGVAILFVLAAGWAALVPFEPDAERDVFDHAGYVRQIVYENDVTPPGVLAAPVDDSSAAPRDPRKGFLHPVVATLADESGVEPLDAWGLLPVVLFPFAFLALLAFYREFTPGTPGLIACVALFVLSFGGFGYRWPSAVGYGQSLSMVWFWMLVPLALRYVRRPRRVTLAAIAVVAAGGVLVHLGVALHAAILIATLWLFARWFRATARALMQFSAVVVVVAGGLLAARVAAEGGPSNAIHTHVQGVLSVTGSFFVASPMEILRQYGMLFLGGLAALPVLLFAGRSASDARRIVAFAVIPVAVCFVPFFATPLYGAGTYMVFRSLLNVPAYAAIVVGAMVVVSGARSGGLGAKVTGTVVLAVWSLVFLVPTLNAVSRDVNSDPAKARALDVEVVRFVRRLPAGSVVLSDPRTSYELSALSDHRFVAVHGQHGTPRDPYAMQRLRACRDVLSPYTLPGTAARACDAFGVDVVVVNGASGSSAGDFPGVWRDRDYALTLEKFGAIGGRFREIHRAGNATVFLYDDEGTLETVRGPVTPAYFTIEGDTLDACVVPAPDGAFEVATLGLSDDEFAPGDTLRVVLGYRKSDVTPFDFPYWIDLRLDHSSIGARREYPGVKFVRRFTERRTGERLRYTVTRRPLAGALDVDQWPLGITFYEAFGIVMPAGMAPGRYAVEVNVRRDALLPVFRIDDLLFNRDSRSGVMCARFSVVEERGAP